jgi:hypothetical protein
VANVVSTSREWLFLPVTAATGMSALGLWLMARDMRRDPAAGPEREPAAA